MWESQSEEQAQTSRELRKVSSKMNPTSLAKKELNVIDGHLKL